MKLLLIEQDAVMQAALARALRCRGMVVHAYGDEQQALGRWKEAPPDVVLIDISENEQASKLVDDARKAGLNTPVLAITAPATPQPPEFTADPTAAALSADDAIAKPIDLATLEDRLRSLSRRQARLGADRASHALQIGTLRYEKESGSAYHQGEAINLTPRERALLEALMESPGEAVSKERLFELIFSGEPDVQYEAVEVVVYRLRKKLAASGVTLLTLRGRGYMLKAL